MNVVCLSSSALVYSDLMTPLNHTTLVFSACFPQSVSWMYLEFDPQCSTYQPEDVLHVYLPSVTRTKRQSTVCPTKYWQVLPKYSGRNWPTSSIILPGANQHKLFVRLCLQYAIGFHYLLPTVTASLFLSTALYLRAQKESYLFFT